MWRRHTPRPAEFFYDIVRTLHNLCPIADEGVCTQVSPAQHVARHGHHLPALFEGARGGNQRAGLFIRLDHDNRSRQATDEAIAHREVKRERWRAGRILADHQTRARDLVGERRVFMRIDTIDAGAEDGDRSARADRAAMGRGIDAARQTADDGDAQRRQVGAQPRRGLERHRCRGARPDDGDRRRAQRVQGSAIPEHGRHIRDGQQGGREPRVVPRKHVDPRGVCGRPHDSRAVAQGSCFFEQDWVVRAKAVGEADAGQIGHERQRNRLIERHEVSRRARGPAALAASAAENDKRPEPPPRPAQQ